MPNEKESPTIRIEAEFSPEVTVYFFKVTLGWPVEHNKNADDNTANKNNGKKTTGTPKYVDVTKELNLKPLAVDAKNKLTSTWSQIKQIWWWTVWVALCFPWVNKEPRLIDLVMIILHIHSNNQYLIKEI